MKRKLTVLLALAMVLMSLGLAGCDGAANPDPATEPEPVQEVDINQLNGPDLHFTPEDFPVIDGATALAPYYEAMASVLLDMDVDEARQYVLCNKTDGAYNNLVKGKADIIFCSQPSEYQKQMADSGNVVYDMTPFLNGAFVFFVNKDNPVDSITIKQAHDIYAGKITNWKELGGNDVDIIAYQRPNDSGSQTGLYAYIIDEEELTEAPSEMVIGSMEGIVDAVSVYENAEGAIGYSFYYYVTSMHYQDNIKLLAINGIEPSDETISNGTYPIINPSYIIVRKGTPENSPVWDIVEWVTSEKGQELARRVGYVPRVMD